MWFSTFTATTECQEMRHENGYSEKSISFLMRDVTSIDPVWLEILAPLFVFSNLLALCVCMLFLGPFSRKKLELVAHLHFLPALRRTSWVTELAWLPTKNWRTLFLTNKWNDSIEIPDLNHWKSAFRLKSVRNSFVVKVKKLWEGLKIWKNLPPFLTKQLFLLNSIKTNGRFFFKLCGLFRKARLYNGK